jgi:branched-chain amino acid transport system ATP-binding protein
MATLEVTGLEVRYGHLTAVAGIDLRLGDGEVAVVLGANGAGKSSTLNAVCGAVRPAAGRVRLDGDDITRLPAHRIAKLGLVQVPEGRRIIAPLSVEDNLLLGAYTLRGGRARRDALLAGVYELFPILHERRERAGGVLSGGEQQMLAFGRALMADPKVLLLDEPSMGLSPAMVDTVMDAVAEIARTRVLSILMVEQNATAALAVASRAYVVEQGEVVLEGPSAAVADDPLVLRAFLGISDPATPETASP